MKAEYFKKMRWDPGDQRPLPETLDDLNLSEVKKALYLQNMDYPTPKRGKNE